MGKSPAKWIKSVLFGKKASKSSFTKRKETPSSADTNAKLEVSDLTTGPCASPGNEPCSNFIEVSSNKLPDDKVALTSQNQDENVKTVLDLISGDDHTEKTRREQAVTQVQAICRGYLARRGFRSLKGVIRLQAFVRGHLVRRQAVATLCCVLSIVKFQALVRRQREPKSLSSLATITTPKLTKSSIARKLLASSPTPRPLRLLYGVGEPNSAWEWLQRWTRSHFQHKETVFGLKSQVKPDSEPSMPKHGSITHPQNEVFTGKRKMKKLSNSTASASDQMGTATKVIKQGIFDSVVKKKKYGNTIELTHHETRKRHKKRASASLPAKNVNGLLHSTTKEPSYMAATESAKAKLRMQAIPKLATDEKIGFHRRHSLPSCLSGDLVSLSMPLAQPNGKVRIKVGMSLSSSRSSTDETSRPGWRR